MVPWAGIGGCSESLFQSPGDVGPDYKLQSRAVPLSVGPRTDSRGCRVSLTPLPGGAALEALQGRWLGRVCGPGGLAGAVVQLPQFCGHVSQKGESEGYPPRLRGSADLPPCLGRAAGWTSYQYGPLTEDSNQAELLTRPSVQVLGSLISHC